MIYQDSRHPDVNLDELLLGKNRTKTKKSKNTITKIKDLNMTTHIDKYFAYEHLPPHLQEISKPIGDLAKIMQDILPENEEKTAGMRKLLEAKDCFVRAKLG